MAISVVGVFGNTDATAGTYNITLSGTAAGDVVYVFWTNASSISDVPSGYTGLGAAAYQTVFRLYYARKVLTAADSVITVQGRSTDYGTGATAIVLRGVDNTTPEDATITKIENQSAAGQPDSPTIVTVTAGALVISSAASYWTTTPDTTWTEPSGYSNKDVRVATTGAVINFGVGQASKDGGTAGSKNPGAWSAITLYGGWAAITVAVRPAATASTGTGTLKAGSAAVDGTGTSLSTGTGALQSQAADVAGTGAASITGTGALQSDAATVTGVGTSTSVGTGALSAQAADVVGAGTSLSTGTGALSAQAAAVSGTGVSSSTGTGALEAQAADVSGTGVSSSTGTGALQSQSATVMGTEAFTGTGTLDCGPAAVSGTGVSSSTGTGALEAGAADVNGAGISSSTGTGVLEAQAAQVSGTGNVAYIAVGVLTVGASTVIGVGTSSSTGTGTLQSQAAKVKGYEVPPPPPAEGGDTHLVGIVLPGQLKSIPKRAA